MNRVMSLHDAVAKYVESGDSICFGGFTTNRKPYAAVAEILRQGQKDFTVWAGPAGGDWDMMIGEGRVKAYIIDVNPGILVVAGIPLSAAITATCIGAGVMTICMGLFSNRPLACASGMGVNAVVAFTLSQITNGDWHAAMAVIFIEGLAILLLVLCGLREAIMNAIPVSLRHAISVGLGLFIAMIGLKNAGILVANESTMVALGDIFKPTFIVGLVSIVATVILYSAKVKGALLIGIILAVLTGIPLGVTAVPEGIISGLDFSSFGAPFQVDANGVMGIVKVLTTPVLLVFAFSFTTE